MIDNLTALAEMASAISRYMVSLEKPRATSQSSVAFLLCLKKAGDSGRRISDIRRKIGFTRIGANQLCSRLVKLGLVKRLKDDDGEPVGITLTKNGIEWVDGLMKAVETAVAERIEKR